MFYDAACTPGSTFSSCVNWTLELTDRFLYADVTVGEYLYVFLNINCVTMRYNRNDNQCKATHEHQSPSQDVREPEPASHCLLESVNKLLEPFFVCLLGYIKCECSSRFAIRIANCIPEKNKRREPFEVFNTSTSGINRYQ